jgi:DNA-binding transcriptional ArsR family regulator
VAAASEPLPDIATVLRTLADPTRRSLFERIVQAGETTVGALAHSTPISQPAVSQHIRALKEAGLLAERRQGRNTHYRPLPQGLAPLVDWLGLYGAFWRDRFTALEQLLKEIDHG